MERIRIRTAAAGAVVELVIVGMLVAFSGGFGNWGVQQWDAASIERMGTWFVVWGAIAWLIAAFVGGYVAAMLQRPESERDGALLGFLSGAFASFGATIFGAALLFVAISTGMATRDLGFAIDARMLPLAIGDLLALLAAMLGGLYGVRSEARVRARVTVRMESREVRS